MVSKAAQGNTAGTGFVLNPGDPGDPQPIRLSTPGSLLHWLCFLISLVPLCHSVSGPVLGWGLSPNSQYPLHSSSGFITELNTHSCSTQVDPSRCSVSLSDLCPFILSCKAPCPDQDILCLQGSFSNLDFELSSLALHLWLEYYKHSLLLLVSHLENLCTVSKQYPPSGQAFFNTNETKK